ncbi:MAG: TIGR03960 family B12-binding radical SAM protein [Myxococcales bacterium]|nr:TIGR03960 family B12-binding radical SAM protein [Myxococcales bacterium]
MRHLYADFIHTVAKPARYLGGEFQSIVKDHAAVDATVCLGFPDVYDIGMSHLGTKILYSLLGKEPRIACERVFAPWPDMEAQIRAHELPLVALESQRPLSDFDVLGISLQYEMTFTNILTLLDLGGIPLRAATRHEGRGDGTLVLGGGPVASHPEPVAAFFDAFFLGEAEALLPRLVLRWAAYRREIGAGTRTRRDALCELAREFPLYVPSLYATKLDEATGMEVVDAPLDPRVPARVVRAMVRDLDAYPFPTDAPVPYAEAVFERAAVEIARGCTEGCRFCQAGMIYRPVRERSPESIIASVIGGVEKGGYEETGLTCLSTADYSSITPLVAKLGKQLRERNVSMAVASLRAYGLGEEILDEMAQTRISGLTFAPEAGTQRMRDVVNKNITEAHVEESARRVFSRGWHRLKLYFMIGLPTEQNEDVFGIIHTGQRMMAVGRQLVGNHAEVTVSVSSHVPKPHTPFQWAAQNSLGEIERKQQMLRATLSDRKMRLKYHDAGVSWVEGVLSRGDRPLADVIEAVWRDGARFDSWEEMFDLERWQRVLAQRGIDAHRYLDTRPTHARLPWDHLDVGLEDGFLLAEYRKALKGRASPPCGKVAGMLVHHTNLADAEPDGRKLVCYDCGVACDLSEMRGERLVALRTLGALQPRTPVVAEVATGDDVANRNAKDVRDNARRQRVLENGYKDADVPYASYRVRYAKLGRVAFLGHLDIGRLMARSLRRAQLPLAMSRGFSPKPRLSYGPALGLGMPSLCEVIDLDLEHVMAHGSLHELSCDEVATRLAQALPEGLVVQSVTAAEGSLGKLVTGIDWLVRPAGDGMVFDASRARRVVDAFMARAQCDVTRGEKVIDVRSFVTSIEVVAGADANRLCAALDWPAVGGAADRVEALLAVTVRSDSDGSAKPSEIARALGIYGGEDLRGPHALIARLSLHGLDTPVATRPPPVAPSELAVALA